LTHDEKKAIGESLRGIRVSSYISSPVEEEFEASESSSPEPYTTTSGSQNKKKRGQRGRTQYPKGQWTVNAISAA